MARNPDKCDLIITKGERRKGNMNTLGEWVGGGGTHERLCALVI